MKMKELEQRTGLGRDTIHFYIREGLLAEPERPKRNVAIYTDDHVRRLRLIRRLQEERFFPLSVIRDIVNKIDELSDGSGTLTSMDVVLFSIIYGTAPTDDVPLAEAAAAAGLTDAQVQDLIDVEVIEPVKTDKGLMLDFRDVALINVAGEMVAAGYTEEAGFPLKTLAWHVGAVRQLAKDEVAIFRSSLNDDVPLEAAAEMAERGVELLNRLLTILRTRTILREFQEAQPEDA